VKKALTQINEQRLSGTHNRNITTNPTNLKSLEQLSRKWEARSYYASPRAAMEALMEGSNE